MKPAVVRWIGIGALVSTVATVWLGLWVTPPDKVQGNIVRLLYIHPPVAWVALYLAFGIVIDYNLERPQHGHDPRLVAASGWPRLTAVRPLP